MTRLANPQDREFIAQLASAFDRFGPYVQVFAHMLDGNPTALVPYGVNGEVALFIHENGLGQRTGFVAVEWRQREGHSEGHIHGVVVDDGFRRQGVATQLLDHVEQLARRRGIATLEGITAETDNAPALHCFTQSGFDNVGYVGQYPLGQRAVRLCRKLH